MKDLVTSIRDQHEACITRSCQENGCSLKLAGLASSSLAMIHGTKYQRQNNFGHKLCDRIIVCGEHGCIVVAVELKGGNSIHLSNAITQIQNGLTVADDILQGHDVDDWHPILVYSGHIGPTEIRLLRTRSVVFRGKPKIVIKMRCNRPLTSILLP